LYPSFGRYHVKCAKFFSGFMPCAQVSFPVQ
jgi:hypothetical protein